MNLERITMGVCYYPEHWREEMWRDDLERMKKCGIEVVRIAEFAWNCFEPKEGVYTFELFDKFMDLAQEMDVKVIFCTPTATPPAWLTNKYPEILNADIDGNLVYHGLRRHCNLNSKVYKSFSAKITRVLAEHYSGYSNLIGWQLDNEINCECDVYYSESDHKAFRKYLRNKFGTLEKLNESMGTTFWNQTYTDWNEIYLARRTNALGNTNPHMQLEEKRFISETVIEFFRIQADIIKEYRRPEQFITTNGIFRHINYHKLVDEVLDFITYDNYPNFAFESTVVPERTNGLKDRNSSYNLTNIRSISSVFGIMEQQSGGGGWNCRMMQPMPKPGQMTLWTMQSIAHGADFISYFRWRTCTFGTEIYWHGLNDYSNKPNRRVAEVGEISKIINNIQEVTGAEYYAEVAIIKDYDNAWDGENDIWHGNYDYRSTDAWFRALQKQHIPFDFLYMDDDTSVEELSKYKQLVYPHPTILSEKRAKLLYEYVNNGGRIIFGCRTGYKDLDGRCFEMPMPCYASELCGTEVKEFTVLSAFDDEEFINVGGERVPAPMFNDVLEATTAEVIGSFENNHYDGAPAATKNSVGKGEAYYVGAVFCEESARSFSKLMGMKTPLGLADAVEVPEELEIAVRVKGDTGYLFVLNFDKTANKIKLNRQMTELVSGKEMNGECEVAPYGCFVFRYEIRS